MDRKQIIVQSLIAQIIRDWEGHSDFDRLFIKGLLKQCDLSYVEHLPCVMSEHILSKEKLSGRPYSHEMRVELDNTAGVDPRYSTQIHILWPNGTIRMWYAMVTSRRDSWTTGIFFNDRMSTYVVENNLSDALRMVCDLVEDSEVKKMINNLIKAVIYTKPKELDDIIQLREGI